MSFCDAFKKLSFAHRRPTLGQPNIGLQQCMPSAKLVPSRILQALQAELKAIRQEKASITASEGTSNYVVYQESLENRPDEGQILPENGTVVDGDDVTREEESLEISRGREVDEEELDSDGPIPNEYRPDRKVKVVLQRGDYDVSEDYTFFAGWHHLSEIEGRSQTTGGRHGSTVTTEDPPRSWLMLGSSTVVSEQNTPDQDVSELDIAGPNTAQQPVKPQGPVRPQRLARLQGQARIQEQARLLELASPQGPARPQEPPYPFMGNPRHPDPETALLDSDGLGIDCPDGCPDCEVWPYRVYKAKDRADAWFDKHFSQEDARRSSFDYPEKGPIESLPDPKLETYRDYLLGGTDSNDLPHFKQLCHWAQQNTPGEKTATSVMRNMRNGEMEHFWHLPYYHGVEYNAIMAEYEPRYIPNDYRSWPFVDARLPIWEARGLVGPGQMEEARCEQIAIEHQQQWVMYRLQDEARQQYIEMVREHARWQFVQAGHLTPQPQ